MKTEFIKLGQSAPIGIVFGGNPEMRNHVIQLFESFDQVSVIGVLSEEEGIAKLKSLSKVDFALIGGRYSLDQRIRIRKSLKEFWPKAFTTEPGIDYTYGEKEILNDLTKRLGL